jgi:hypothetical protein
MFWYPLLDTSRSSGFLEVPAASSADGCGAPASRHAFSTRSLWSKQLATGGQTLTCVICRRGISGLDLFFTTGTGFELLGLGGGESSSVVFSSGAGGSGAGVAETGFGLNPKADAVLMKQNQLYH